MTIENRLPKRLAIYANPMRNDGVFVYEEKPIEPYDAGVYGINGEFLYPAVPQNAIGIGIQIPRHFAEEIVRRWNSFNENEEWKPIPSAIQGDCEDMIS